jgi:uncharacterized MAPEG superfamily protein
MTTPLWSLFAFVAFAIGSILGSFAWRGALMLQGKAKITDFKKDDMSDRSEAYRRFHLAQLNVTTNLPIFASVVVIGALAGVSSAVFAQASVILVGARAVQFSAQVISMKSVVFVNTRFAAYLVQVGALAAMMLEVVRSA